MSVSVSNSVSNVEIGDGQKEIQNWELRRALTAGLLEFLKEQGFNTTGSSEWEVYVWEDGEPWKTDLVTIGCFVETAEWNVAHDSRRGCKIQLCEPLEEVVKLLKSWGFKTRPVKS